MTEQQQFDESVQRLKQLATKYGVKELVKQLRKEIFNAVLVDTYGNISEASRSLKTERATISASIGNKDAIKFLK